MEELRKNLCFIIIIHTFFRFVISSNLIVRLSDGPILGRTAKTFGGKPFYVFQGIPYAAPPIGKLRFMSPLPPKKWKNVRNATFLDVICHQNTVEPTQQSEDCLYLNVYTPELPEDSKNGSLPVLVFIHGGGFIFDSSMQYKFGPEYLMDYGIIVVTLNYRLGAFGFLATGDLVVPGNNGLKDQLLAIKWVYNNIALFGGDYKKITISGQSAGATSVNFHLLNTNSAGLYRAAIMESGTALNYFALQRNARNNLFSVASKLNFSFTDRNNTSAVVEYLLTIPAKDLQEVAGQILDWFPVIEPKHRNAVITAKMYVLLKKGKFIKVPILMGMTAEEGILFAQDLVKFREALKPYDKNVTLLVPSDLNVLLNDTQKEVFGNIIKEMYVGNETFNDNLAAGIRYESDNLFVRSILKCAQLCSKFTQVYFYQFSYDGSMGNFNLKVKGTGNVAHTEELLYIWRQTDNGYDNSDLSQFPEKDVLTQHRMLTLWTNFVKTSKPTPRKDKLLQNVVWPTMNSFGNFLYLDINENLKVKNYPREKTYKQWLKIYALTGYDDFDTF